MPEQKNTEELNSNVKKWWNDNPYTYGLSNRDRKKGGYIDVGDIDDSKLTPEYFEKYMKKARKHFRDAQKPEERTAARFIDYDAIKGKKVLDIAIGVGWSVVEMAGAGAFVTGIDLTPRAIEITKKHLELKNLTADLRVMDAQKLDFPDATFDFVLAWGCLMHMPKTEQAMSGLYRVLKNGGKLTSYMYNKNSVSYWWHFWFLKGILSGKLLKYKGNTTKLVSRYTDGYKIGGNQLTKVYTPKETKKMFETAGFKNVEVKPWGPPQGLDDFPCHSFKLGKYLPYSIKKRIADHWGWGMIIYAQK
jgi:ubiquinone/menaquinone biosynthesis C-methylase UbiE